MISVHLFDHVDETLTGRYVYSTVFLVVEDIIRITGTIHHGDLFPRFRVEHCKACWFAEANEKPVMRFI
ncbi:MAG: hypothetical protein AUG12_00985 [Acidobacteria bacterium 13_1_20CM_2_57_8]|nr:MAG: hypothetical protein AUG12_00985 [Acidobacteria bacterium 13_1_20CM_2_57_8]